MSKIYNDILNQEDHHNFHQSVHEDCEFCKKERRALQSWKIVNTKRLREELLGGSTRQIDDPRWTKNPLD